MTEDKFAPGQVWWCDGVLLGFEANFKRRPVLIIEAESAEITVIALSSRRIHGQEKQVTHNGGHSYLTGHGQVRSVPPEALLKSLGNWDQFAAWQAEQQQMADAAARIRSWRSRLRAFFRGDR